MVALVCNAWVQIECVIIQPQSYMQRQKTPQLWNNEMLFLPVASDDVRLHSVHVHWYICVPTEMQVGSVTSHESRHLSW